MQEIEGNSDLMESKEDNVGLTYPQLTKNYVTDPCPGPQKATRYL
jgi:hypothetical protein